MTVIVSFLRGDRVFQASDRLVSAVSLSHPLSPPRPFDKSANKCVLVLARDFVVSIGYTGVAYVDNMPTDEWIVKTICRRPIARFKNDPVLVDLSKVPQFIRGITQAVWHIKGALDSAFDSDAELRKGRMEMELVGWRWRKNGKRKPEPFLFNLTREGYNKCVMQWTRRISKDEMCSAWAPSAHGPTVTEFENLKAAVSRSRHYEAFRDAAVSNIRSISERHPGYVGPSVLFVMISPPAHKSICVEFVSALGKDGQSRADCGYSPWIIGQTACYAPATISGFFRIEIDEWRIDIMGGPMAGKKRSVRLMLTQSRPRSR